MKSVPQETDSPIAAVLAPEQYYGIIRGQIEHEDDLISQRISWFVAAQAFLFTAYAIVVSNLGIGRPQWVSDQMRRLFFVVPLTAILTCILIYATIVAGFLAMRNLRRLHDEHAPATHPTLPPVQGYRRTQVLGLLAPLVVPLVFLAVWLYLLIASSYATPVVGM